MTGLQELQSVCVSEISGMKNVRQPIRTCECPPTKSKRDLWISATGCFTKRDLCLLKGELSQNKPLLTPPSENASCLAILVTCQHLNYLT